MFWLVEKGEHLGHNFDQFHNLHMGTVTRIFYDTQHRQDTHNKVYVCDCISVRYTLSSH